MIVNNQFLLYNNTYSLHRVSPLYIKNTAPIENSLLSYYARKFQELLTGDVLRGVKTGAVPDNDIEIRAGSLQAVKWIVFDDNDIMGLEKDDASPVMESSNRGMLFTVTYQNIEYRAIFLQSLCPTESRDTEELGDGFLHFPLLLLKMPGPLRRNFIEYFATTFDTRISALYLPHRCLIDCFDQYISDLRSSDVIQGREDVHTSVDMNDLIKHTGVRLGFDLPSRSTLLKSIDVQIPSEDVPLMIARGGKAVHTPFFEALKTYLNANLALDVSNPRVKIERISCAAFNLSIEGKFRLTKPLNLKFNSPHIRANRRLICSIIEAATCSMLSSSSSTT